MNAHDKGDLVRLSAGFTNIAGVATDPTTVSLSYRKPNGVQATVTFAGAQIVKDSVGNYHYDLTVDVAGLWNYRWVATGAAQSAEQGQFLVKSNPLEATDR